MKTKRIALCIAALPILAALTGNPSMTAAKQKSKPVLMKVTQKQAVKILKDYCKDLEYKTFDIKQYPRLKKFTTAYHFFIGVHGDCESDFLYLINKRNGDVYILYPIGKPELLRRTKSIGRIHQLDLYECSTHPFLAEA